MNEMHILYCVCTTLINSSNLFLQYALVQSETLYVLKVKLFQKLNNATD